MPPYLLLIVATYFCQAGKKLTKQSRQFVISRGWKHCLASSTSPAILQEHNRVLFILSNDFTVYKATNQNVKMNQNPRKK
jgi:hypothetical protein